MTPSTRAIGTTILMLLIAGAARASPIGVDPTGDASGPFGAASLVGDATTGADCYALPPPIFLPCLPLFAVTGTGDASGGYVAASGSGDASDALIAVSGTGEARGYLLSICVADPLACQHVDLVATVITGARLGPDADGDGVPAYVEADQTMVSVDRHTLAVTTTDMGTTRRHIDANDNDPRTPVPEPSAPQEATVRVPRGLVLGLDQDGDAVPSDATVYYAAVTVRADGAFTVGDGGSTRARIDPADDDPNTPVRKPVAPDQLYLNVPTGVAVGPDADGDGSPAYVDVQQTRFVVDLRTFAVESWSFSPIRAPVDPDDSAREVHVTSDEDAEASVLAVSATGDATSCEPRVTCVAISVTGDADGYYAASGTGDATGCTSTHFLCAAASGTGDASSTDYAVSAIGSAHGSDAAVSGAGPARGVLVASGANDCNGGRCAGLGSDSKDAYYIGVGDGESRGLVAVSTGGDAEGGVVAVSLDGEADAPVAVRGCDQLGC